MYPFDIGKETVNRIKSGLYIIFFNPNFNYLHKMKYSINSRH